MYSSSAVAEVGFVTNNNLVLRKINRGKDGFAGLFGSLRFARAGNRQHPVNANAGHPIHPWALDLHGVGSWYRR